MAFDTGIWTASLLTLSPDAKRVVFGSQVTYGLLDDDEQIVNDGTGSDVTVRTRQVTIAADSLAGLVDGSAITVGGVAYTVRNRPMPRENGDLWAVSVVRA